MLSSIVMDKRQLLLLCLGYSFIAFNATITIRLTPVYAVQLGAQPGLTGLMVSLAFLAVTTGGIVGGALADRTGRQRAILLISCCAWIATTYLLTHATTIPWLIFAGALLWFPGGFLVAMLNVITALSSQAQERGTIFGLTAFAGGIGGFGAGAIGGAVAERWGFLTLFEVMAAVCALVLLLAIFIQEKPRTQTATGPALPESATPAAGPPVPAPVRPGLGYRLFLLMGANFLLRLSLLAGGLGITLLMVQQGYETAAIASTISASAAVSLPLPLVLGWLSDRMARKQILLMINGLVAGGLLVLASASWLWQFWLSAMMMGIGDRSQGVTNAYAVDLTSSGALGRNLALLGSSGGIAGVIGLGSAGFVMELIGIRATMAAIAGLAMVSMLLLMCIRMPAPVMDLAVDLAEGQPQEAAPLYQSAVSGKRIDTDVEAV